MAGFEHKGIKIVVESSGLFSAPSRPDVTAQDSLEKVKAKIDAVLKREQKPFKALMFSGKARWDRNSGTSAENVTVTSISKGRYGGHSVWIKDAKGNRSKESLSEVFVHSVDNLAIMEEVGKLRRERKALDDKIEKTLQRLQTIDPSNAVDEVD